MKDLSIIALLLLLLDMVRTGGRMKLSEEIVFGDLVQCQEDVLG